MTYDADARWWQNRANRAEERAERAEADRDNEHARYVETCRLAEQNIRTLARVRDLHAEAAQAAVDYMEYGDQGASDAYGWARDGIARALDGEATDA